MKLLITATSVLGAGVIALVVVIAILFGDVRTLQAHARQDQRVIRTQESTLTARVNGQHRDLITCGDLQNLGLASYWQDSNYNLQSNPIILPGHCINR